MDLLQALGPLCKLGNGGFSSNHSGAVCRGPRCPMGEDCPGSEAHCPARSTLRVPAQRPGPLGLLPAVYGRHFFTAASCPAGQARASFPGTKGEPPAPRAGKSILILLGGGGVGLGHSRCLLSKPAAVPAGSRAGRGGTCPPPPMPSPCSSGEGQLAPLAPPVRTGEGLPAGGRGGGREDPTTALRRVFSVKGKEDPSPQC